MIKLPSFDLLTILQKKAVLLNLEKWKQCNFKSSYKVFAQALDFMLKSRMNTTVSRVLETVPAGCLSQL